MPKTPKKQTEKTVTTVKTQKNTGVSTSKPKLSVIIPFYNVEDYIEECLKSVLSQTIKDLEVILINDASTDKTRSIVQKYADKDSRIKIIDIEKQSGQGFARNRGIEIAQGEYIGFVDSDDFIEKDMYELLLNKAKETDSDITMCQAREYDDMNEQYFSSNYYALSCLGDFENKVFSSEDTKEQLLDINVALWNKVYKREYLLSTGEKFPEGFIYEDLPFFFGTYLPAKKISIVWKSLYNYRINRKNSTMQQFNNRILDRPPMVSLTYEKIKKAPYFEEIKKKVQGWVIDDLFHRYVLLKEKYHKELFFLMKNVFKNLQIEDRKDDFWKFQYHFQGYTLVMDNNFEDFNQKIFNKYVDVHEMEKLFESKTILAPELHDRFNRIYQDLQKYEAGTNARTDVLISDVYKVISEGNVKVDNQVAKIYNDISKIYEFVNNSRSDIEYHSSKNLDDKINLVYEDMSKTYEYTNSKEGELKAIIQEALNEISKNYDYINEQTDEIKSKISDNFAGVTGDKLKELHNEIKDEIKQNISYVANIFKESTNEKLANAAEKITRKSYEYSNEQFDKLKFEIARSSSDLEQKVRENTKTKINDLKDELKSDIATTVSAATNTLTKATNDKISELYDEISKSYNYTNEQNDEVKLEVVKSLDKLSSDITAKTNERISSVYDELSKNYDFTKEQNKELKDDFTNKIETERNIAIERENNIYTHIDNMVNSAQEHLDNIAQETRNELENTKNSLNDSINDSFNRVHDEIFVQKSYIEGDTDVKLSQVYEQISQHKEHFDTENRVIKQKLNDAIDSVINDSNYKQEQIYNEINKNLQYTNDLSNNIREELSNRINESASGLYGDIKDLSYVVQNNFTDLTQEQEKLRETTQQLFSQVQTSGEEQLSYVRNELNDKFNTVSNIINNTENQVNSMIEDVKNIIEKEKQNNETIITRMKTEFSELIKEQQRQHNNEVLELREQIKQLEADLREEMKSPIAKLLEKYHRKSER